MKRHILIAFSALLLMSSCFEDKGNYEYREINQTTIVKLAEIYTVPADVGILKIDPSVTMTMADPDDERFQHLWIVEFKESSSLNPIHILDTIGRTRVLEWQANLPLHTYTMTYKIIDTQTGIVEQTESKLTLTMYHGRGIMLAAEDEGGYFKGQMLVMMSGEETVLYDDLLQYSGLPQLRGAIDFFHTGNTRPENSRAIWIVTEDGTYFIDRFSLRMEDHFNRFEHKMYFPTETPIDPIDIGPRINATNGDTGGNSNGTRFILCSNGDVYNNWISVMGDVYDLPVSNVSGDGDLKAKAMFITQKEQGISNIMVYDGNNERFLRLNLAGTTCLKLTDVQGDVFPWNQNGRTFVYGENTLKGTQNGYSFAIMKETADNPDREYDYCIYEFYPILTVKRALYEVKKAAAPLFGQASAYAFSSKRTAMFYVVDGKLYAYDYDPSVNRNYEISLADNHEVTMIKFDMQREPNSDYLYVATYDSATGGTLYKYEIDTNLNVVQLKNEPTETWTGLAKVKNMSWRGSE